MAFLRRMLLAMLCLGWAGAAAAQPVELTVDAAPALSDAAQRVRAFDLRGAETALARAGLQLPPRVHVILIESSDVRARETPDWIAGRAFGAELVVLFPERVGSYPYDSLESVVLHEIVHLALNRRAGGRPLPRWFHEGVAVSVESGWGIGSQARLLLAAAQGPAIEHVGALFASQRVPETSTAYLLSAALIEDVRRRHGLEVPGAIAARVARGEPFDRAFFAATGENVDEAAAHAWAVYRGLRWLPVLTSGTALWGGILALAFIAFAIRIRRRRQKQWEEDELEPPDEDVPTEDDGQPPPRPETIH